jgi:glycogen operon protein
MILFGDEAGRTQNGNNNAFCQDNEISWFDWQHADKDLLDYCRKLISFRKSHPSFARRGWFKGQNIKGVGVEDIAWFQMDGNEMTEENWNTGFAKTLAIYLNGHGLRWVNETGERVVDDNFYIIFNAHHDAINFKLPVEKYGRQWACVINSAEGKIGPEEKQYAAGSEIAVAGRSMIVLTNSESKNEPSEE